MAGIQEEIVTLLKEKKCTVTFAESCTGGKAAAALVGVSGASEVFEQSYVTYSDKAKHKLLGVKKSTLKKYTAVSKQTAKQMVKGALKAAKTDYAAAITGYAGPDGGTKEDPVGTVYIGAGCKDHISVVRYVFTGDRESVRNQSTQAALKLLLKEIKNERNN